MANKAINDLLKYNLMWRTWEQPTLANNTTYGVVSGTQAGVNAYRASDKNQSTVAEITCLSQAGRWKWILPQNIKISNISISGEWVTGSYVATDYLIYSNESETNLMTTTSGASNASTYTTSGAVSNVITNVIVLRPTVSANYFARIREMVITAEILK